VTVRVGIGGWDFAPWRGRFYPAGLPKARELSHAASRLTAIEINGTFYRHQSPATFAAWRDAVPEGFMFAVKAHRACTQGRDLYASGDAIARFLDSGVLELGAKLGPILWQLAPTKKFDPLAMEAFLAMLPATLDGVMLRHAVEARHESFLDPAWPALAARYGVAVVIVDSDKQTLRLDATAGFVYARLQRTAAGAAEGYDSAALDTWASRLTGWAPRDAFCFFISGDKERAPDAALAMIGRIGDQL
jgi:uncharacterized protein YecE (DUF72 family)